MSPLKKIDKERRNGSQFSRNEKNTAINEKVWNCKKRNEEEMLAVKREVAQYELC